MTKENVKVLFIYFRTMKVFVASIASLSAYAKSNGFTNTKVTCILEEEFQQPDYENIFKAQIREHAPDIVCISTLTNYWAEIKAITAWTKEVSSAKILCGGYHASLFPEEVMSHQPIDGLCLGEGEDALVDVLNSLPDGSWAEIPNIWSRNGEEIIRNDPRPLIRDLNSCPPWDRDVFQENGINGIGNAIIGEFVKDQTVATVAASRGCYHKCAYCSNHAFSCLYPKQERTGFVRKKTVDRVIDELKDLRDTYAPDLYEFVDEVFPREIEWLTEFKKAYCMHINKPFSAFVRIGMFTEEGYRLLKESGCNNIYVGVECGNEAFRKDILNKPIKNEDIKAHFRILKSLGIRTTTFNMIGLPFETKALIQETIDLNREIGACYPLFFSYQPLVGTQLYDLCITHDLIKDRNANDNYYCHTAKLKLDLSADEWNVCWDNIKALQQEASGKAQMHLP